MWSHYADSHKGVVIRFRVIPELQTAFCAASPVKYSEMPPNLGTFDDMFYTAIGAKKRELNALNDKCLFTKSLLWSYKKEWRFSVKVKRMLAKRTSCATIILFAVKECYHLDNVCS